MNHDFVSFGREEVFAELTEHIVELREISDGDAEVMASKVLSRASSTIHLVGLSDNGKRALYHWETSNPGAWASLIPFDERGVDSLNAIIIWQATDEDQPDDFETWLKLRLDGLDWIHPDYV
ncbi:hypothetical protein [Haladaptatus halobius]|uniref:hypothetical protein n=1 Tax=Haladaptatus halobius TaxID=2884875 RepID=UPI001D0AC22E|nr:hypothetical protein [Haladaptatus halobius]